MAQRLGIDLLDPKGIRILIRTYAPLADTVIKQIRASVFSNIILGKEDSENEDSLIMEKFLTYFISQHV